VQEGAFWSHDLYKWAGRAGATFFFVLVGVAALGVLLILGLDESEVAVNAARIFAVLVLLVASLDFVGRSLAWFSGSGVSGDVVNAFDRSTTEELPAALSVFADYSVATATAPPIPNWIYRRRKNALNKAWQARSAPPT